MNKFKEKTNNNILKEEDKNNKSTNINCDVIDAVSTNKKEEI